jgi:tetratricopeptide (TPR) repeat protein
MEEVEFEQCLEELMKENDGFDPNSLMSREQQIERKREEYRQLLQMKTFREKIEFASEVILKEMPTRLSEEENDNLITELSLAGDTLLESPEVRGDALGITKPVMDSINSLALEMLNNAKTKEAVALFSLLSVLDPSWYRHWFYLGVAEQEEKQYDEAIKAYDKANEIVDNDPKAHLLAAECYLAKSDSYQARQHLDAANAIIQKQPNNPDWQDHYARLDAQVTH